jgi:hypothetical protein
MTSRSMPDWGQAFDVTLYQGLAADAQQGLWQRIRQGPHALAASCR